MSDKPCIYIKFVLIVYYKLANGNGNTFIIFQRRWVQCSDS